MHSHQSRAFTIPSFLGGSDSGPLQGTRDRMVGGSGPLAQATGFTERSGFDTGGPAGMSGIRVPFTDAMRGAAESFVSMARSISSSTTSPGESGSIQYFTSNVYATPGKEIDPKLMTKDQFMFGMSSAHAQSRARYVVGPPAYITAQLRKSHQLRMQAITAEATGAAQREPHERSITSKRGLPSSWETVNDHHLNIGTLAQVTQKVIYFGPTVSSDQEYPTGDLHALEPRLYEFAVRGRMNNCPNVWGRVAVGTQLAFMIGTPGTGNERQALSHTNMPPLVVLPLALRDGANLTYMSNIEPLRDFDAAVVASNQRRQRLFGATASEDFMRGGPSKNHAGMAAYMVGNSHQRLIGGIVTEPRFGERSPSGENFAEYDLAHYSAEWIRMDQTDNPGLPEYEAHDPATRVAATWRDPVPEGVNAADYVPSPSTLLMRYVLEVAMVYHVGFVFHNPITDDPNCWPTIAQIRASMTDLSLRSWAAQRQQLQIFATKA